MTDGQQFALQAWQSLLGAEAVLLGDKIPARLRADTAPVSSDILAVLQIASAEQLPDVLRIAQQHGVPVHPTSTASNWGYGSAQPVRRDVTLIDLSGLQRIIHFDAELGVVTVEPGATQGMLADFLDAGGHAFMVPVTGAGPHCSLVANALERGYGITPYGDHFGALTDLEAVLADGSIYRGALREAAGEELARLSKWGIGPYLNGLFAQSGFGIVTRASILLARKPEAVRICLFGLAEDALLEPAIERIQTIMQALPGTVGAMQLMNRHRVLAMTAPYPQDWKIDDNGLMPASLIDTLARQYQIAPWTGFATLYGPERMVRAAQREIRATLKGVAHRLIFLSPSQGAFLANLCVHLPGRLGQRLGASFATLNKAMQLVQGRPNETALPLAFWKSGVKPPAGRLDPSGDGCGLFWYSPLVPMQAASVRRFVDFATSTLVRHGIEPLLTLTSQSDRLFDCTVPLLFNAQSEERSQAARDCLRDLIEEGRTLGFYPYRLHVLEMAAHRERHPQSGSLVDRLRSALDPAHLLAPGRYD